jgi:hypothetical protein
MGKRSIWLGLIVLAFVLVVTATERPQGVAAQASGREHERAA